MFSFSDLSLGYQTCGARGLAVGTMHANVLAFRQPSVSVDTSQSESGMA